MDDRLATHVCILEELLKEYYETADKEKMRKIDEKYAYHLTQLTQFSDEEILQKYRKRYTTCFAKNVIKYQPPPTQAER